MATTNGSEFLSLISCVETTLGKEDSNFLHSKWVSYSLFIVIYLESREDNYETSNVRVVLHAKT